MRFQILMAFALLNIVSLCWAGLQVGAGKRIVTPDPLLPVSGGIGPGHPANRKLHDLWVRAMVLQKNDTRVAIVGCDFLGFPKILGDRVREQVEAIPAENIIIGATHTHSAPDMYGFPNEQGSFSIDLEYINWVCEQMADAIADALSNLQPATLRIATGEAQGRIAYNYYAPELYDPRCSVIQAVNQEGKPIVTLVNYAVHPEVLGSEQGICSPDMIGPLYQRVEGRTGGMAIFMNGAQGGMVTADVRDPETGEDIQTWEECQRIGNLLADEALRIVEDAPAQQDPRLECHARTFTFPIDSELIRMILEVSPLGYEANPDGSVSTQVNLINLGNAQILTIPGEALPNIGYYLKRKMHGEHNLLFGLTNDAFGYILTKVDWNSFERYDYISRTCLGEMTGEIFIEEALEFLNEYSSHHSIPIQEEAMDERAHSTLAARAVRPPYPRSPAIKTMVLDWSTHDRFAQGSDNWQLTWADDDHQYAPWGDGGGFGGTNSDGRVSLGVARIEGPWSKYRGFNVWGGKCPENPADIDGKSWGIVCIGGVLYMWISPGSPLKTMQIEARLYRSSDHAATWQPADWSFVRSDGLSIPTICQFGRDYAAARDEFVYHYFAHPQSDENFDAQKPGMIYLARVPKDQMMERQAYEFFVGFGGNEGPRWSRDLSAKMPVFEDANGVGWNLSVSYNAGLERYILMTEHIVSSKGNLGMFDALEPWGPWTTIAYMNRSDDTHFGQGYVVDNTFFWNIPTKWQSKDGTGFSLIFTGAGRGHNNDSWNMIRGKFICEEAE